MASSSPEGFVADDEILRADVLRHFAHDLKNPLTAVCVLAEMLREDLGGQAREDMDDVIEALDLCTAMAEGLSDLARVEAGAEPTYEFEMHSLTELVERVCSRAGMVKHVERVPSPAVFARMDVGAGQRALTAVLLNARRMLPMARVRVRVLEPATVEVEHPGVRLEPVDAADLVRPYGAARLRDRRVRASALGLAYARSTLEGLGGSLEVLPEESALWVRLSFLRVV